MRGRYTKQYNQGGMRLGILILVLLILLGGAAGAVPYVAGMLIEQRFEPMLKGISEAGLYEWKVTDYRRGWRTSEVKTRLVWSPELKQRALAANQPTPELPEIALAHRITHGPIFGEERSLWEPSEAVIESRLELPPELAKALEPYLGGQSPLKLRTLVHDRGQLDIKLESPPFQADLQDQAKVKIPSARGEMYVSAAFDRFRGDLRLPSVEITDPKGEQLRFDQITTGWSYQRHPKGLWLGETQLRLNGIQGHFAAPGQKDFGLDGLSVTGGVEERGETLLMQSRMRWGNVKAGDTSFSGGELAMELRNLDTEAFSQLMKEVQNLSRLTALDPEQAMGRYQLLLAQMLQLLPRGPEFALTRIDLGTPEGKIQGHFRIGITPGDLAGLTNPAILIKRFSSALELSLPKSLAYQIALMMTMTSGEAAASEQAQPQNGAENLLGNLLAQGLIAEEADRYGVRATIEQGHLQVNGRQRDDLLAGLLGGVRGNQAKIAP